MCARMAIYGPEGDALCSLMPCEIIIHHTAHTAARGCRWISLCCCVLFYAASNSYFRVAVSHIVERKWSSELIAVEEAATLPTYV